MNPMHHVGVANDNLLQDIARTDLSLETVFALYGVAVVIAATLWLVGVLTFGRRAP